MCRIWAFAWEQRKVGDYLIESRIKGNTGNEARKITVKLWGKGVVEKNDLGGSEHTQYFIRKAGQFIYSKLDFLNSAFGVIPENLDEYESTADLPAFDLEGMNPHFMYYVAIQKNFYLKNGSIADGSRKAKRIHAHTFLDMPIRVPSLSEQNTIVHYLQHLDHLITLHQRKYTHYVLYHFSTENSIILRKLFFSHCIHIPVYNIRYSKSMKLQKKSSENFEDSFTCCFVRTSSSEELCIRRIRQRQKIQLHPGAGNDMEQP